MIKWGFFLFLGGALGVAALPSQASACGCFSSPQPPPAADAEAYAVNQQAEQIIFDVDEEAGTVTAHVLIQYAGAPESFAWILPTPTVPTLGLTADLPFALLDRFTAPQVFVGTGDICPQQEYVCRFHPACPTLSPPPSSSVDAGFSGADGAADSSSPPSGPPVEVIDRQILGAYETITFAAGDTAAAITWLQGEGFIVNDTMAPFMQPYADAGMIFVAAKLVPDADVSGIKPLSLTYEGTMPMIPLRLTAVGAEPELTVTAWIFGDEQYRPVGQPLVVPNENRLARDPSGRLNYPMLLSRTIDAEEDGAFVMEYEGPAPQPAALFDPNCCGFGFDSCGWAGDGICACPLEEWEAADCGDDRDEIVALVEQLATNARVTRLTTRLGPHEMTYDPMFEPTPATPGSAGPLTLVHTQSSLLGCQSDIVDLPAFEVIREREACAAVWCGQGTCVLTGRGAACACDPGFAARQFTDLDGEPSVTCVPETSPVDLSAGGIELQSSCGGTDCGLGRCVDQGGFPACVCDDGAGAEVTATGAPLCVPATSRADGAGADDYTGPYADLDVCSPRPPTCAGGWLERVSVSRQGVMCARNQVDPARLVELPPRDCPSLSRAGGGGGCAVSKVNTQAAGTTATFMVFAFVALARRRR